MAKKEQKTEQEVLIKGSFTLDDLYNRIEQMETKLNELNRLAKKIDKDIFKIDTNAFSEVSKRYGFDGNMAYSIGAGSGRMYTTPITKKIARMIEKIRDLTPDEIHELNLIFMKK